MVLSVLSNSLQPNGFPLLSDEDLEYIGERYIADFNPTAAKLPKEIDIDRFAFQYLGMKQDFQYLAHKTIYLGMTVFRESQVPVYNPKTGKAEYILAEAGTAIIDNSLLENNSEHRYRFTVAHEAAHFILHKEFFLNKMRTGKDVAHDQWGSDFPSGGSFLSQCASDEDRKAELQANRLSAVLLMPKKTIEMLLGAMISYNKNVPIYDVLQKIEKIYNVSQESAFYRLKELGYANGYYSDIL